MDENTLANMVVPLAIPIAMLLVLFAVVAGVIRDRTPADVDDFTAVRAGEVAEPETVYPAEVLTFLCHTNLAGPEPVLTPAEWAAVADFAGEFDD